MKAKVGRGGGFRGALSYALGESKQSAIIGGTMAGADPRALAAEFGETRRLRPDAKNPVWHCSLSLPKGDEIDAGRWSAIADDFMAEMGLDSHQWVAVRHGDTEHDHIHIIGSRIGADGSLWYGQWEARKAINATQDLERRHDLTLTAGLDDVTAERRNPTKAEIEQTDRTGEAPVRLRLQRLIDDAISDGPSVTTMLERLDGVGVETRPVVAKTGRLSGFSFGLDGVWFKGSQLGKRYSWTGKHGLQKVAGVTYDESSESGELRRRADEFAEGADQERGPAAGRGDQGDRAGDPAAGRDDQPGRSVDEPSRVEPGRVDGPGRAGGAGSDGSDRGVAAGGAEVPERDDRRGDGLETSERRGDQRGDGHRAEHRGDEPEVGGADRAGDEAARPDGTAAALDGHAADAGDRRSDWRGAAARVSVLAAGRDGGDLAAGDGQMTPAQQAKVAAWQQQAAALDAPQYRITFTPRREGLRPFNQGKGKGPDGGERFYSADEVTDLVPYMSRQNARGYDVYVTPIDPAHHYLVVDDMTPESHAKLTGAGYQPALVLESSQGNRQAVLKAPRADDQDEQKAANRVVQRLNKEVGDPEFSGAVHPFRVAGFSNKKPGRGDVFTRIVEAAGAICRRTIERLQQARDLIRGERADVERRRREQAVRHAPSYRRPVGRDPAGEYRWRARRQAADADWSRVDFGIATGMIRDGWKPGQVEQAILEASPGVAERHNAPEDYARRTVERAAASGQDSGPRRSGPRQDRDHGMSM